MCEKKCWINAEIIDKKMLGYLHYGLVKNKILTISDNQLTKYVLTQL